MEKFNKFPISVSAIIISSKLQEGVRYKQQVLTPFQAVYTFLVPPLQVYKKRAHEVLVGNGSICTYHTLNTYPSLQNILPSVLVVQRNRTSMRDRWMMDGRQIEIYYQVLAHVIMEGEKAHDLLSAGWRPRKPSGAVQRPESEWCRCQFKSRCQSGAPKGRRRLMFHLSQAN